MTDLSETNGSATGGRREWETDNCFEGQQLSLHRIVHEYANSERVVFTLHCLIREESIAQYQNEVALAISACSFNDPRWYLAFCLMHSVCVLPFCFLFGLFYLKAEESSWKTTKDERR
jgi:hypothetical protein